MINPQSDDRQAQLEEELEAITEEMEELQVDGPYSEGLELDRLQALAKMQSEVLAALDKLDKEE